MCLNNFELLNMGEFSLKLADYLYSPSQNSTRIPSQLLPTYKLVSLGS